MQWDVSPVIFIFRQSRRVANTVARLFLAKVAEKFEEKSASLSIAVLNKLSAKNNSL
jgi:hypothetical protein